MAEKICDKGKVGLNDRKKEKERDSRLRFHLETVNWQMKCLFCVCEIEFGIESRGGVEWKLTDTYGQRLQWCLDADSCGLTHSSKFATY